MKAHILVVDDEEVIRNVLHRFLTKQGYTVTTANNGKEALECVQKNPPHLVLLDMHMPVMGGIAALKALMDIDKDIAVMMVTANEDVALAQQALDMGASDYITKPFDLVYLETTVMAKLASVIS